MSATHRRTLWFAGAWGTRGARHAGYFKAVGAVMTVHKLTAGDGYTYFERRLAAIHDASRQARLRKLEGAPPTAMARLLAHLRHRYGGAAAYLERHGLSQRDLELLQQRLVSNDEPAHV